MAGEGRRIAGLAVVAVVAGAASGLLLVRSYDGTTDAGAGTGGGVQDHYAEAGERATVVVDALTAERNQVAIDTVGLSMPDTGRPTAELREDTDRSIAELTGWLGELVGDDAEVVALYQPAVDGLDGLSALRQETDARPDQGAALDFDLADATWQRYVDLAAPLWDAIGEGLGRSTDDPALRQGLLLEHTASAQSATMASLLRAIIVAGTTGGLDEREEIEQVAELLGQFTADAEVIRSIDHSPYRELVEESFPEQLTTDVTAAADAAMAGEPVDLQQVLALAESGDPDDLSYLHLAAQAHDEVRRHADRLDDDGPVDDPEDAVWLLGAVLAGLVAGAALVGIVVTASRRSPPAGPAQWPPRPPGR
jgi:hypothetical protein